MVHKEIGFLWKFFSLSLPTSNAVFHAVMFFNLFIYCQNDEVHFDLDQFKPVDATI